MRGLIIILVTFYVGTIFSTDDALRSQLRPHLSYKLRQAYILLKIMSVVNDMKFTELNVEPSRLELNHPMK